MAHYLCRDSGKTYDINSGIWQSETGGLLEVVHEFELDIQKLKTRKPGMWRYREAIPIIKDENIVSFDEGFTPMQKLDFGKHSLWVKYDHLFTTGSYKDRGASVLISKAKELGVKYLVDDSTGNAGCSMAAYSAKAGIACDIYVPEDTAPAKLAQIEAYGAGLCKVPGGRQKASEAIMKVANKHFYASHAWHPFFFEGTKTFAYEVWEQLGFRAPDSLIIQTGHGTLLIGAYLGFKELFKMGQIKKIPKLIAIQSEHCAPIFELYHNLPYSDVSDTVAEGIGIAVPPRAKQIVEIIKETNGTIIKVSDEAIVEALFEICKKGLYVEPTAAASIAGLAAYKPSASEEIVAPLTGHGLKSTDKYLKWLKK
jgi:threonine synthase